jgi:hypothetical protein
MRESRKERTQKEHQLMRPCAPHVKTNTAIRKSIEITGLTPTQHPSLLSLLLSSLRLRRRSTSFHKHRIVVAVLRGRCHRGRSIFLVAFELRHELALDSGALVLPPGLVGVELGLHFDDAGFQQGVLVDFVGGLKDYLAPVGGECVGLFLEVLVSTLVLRAIFCFL